MLSIDEEKSDYVFTEITDESKEEFRDSIVNYLEDRNMYHESDNILINEVLFNVEVLFTAKADIFRDGIKTDVTRDPDKGPFYQKNRTIDVYQQALKNIQTLFRQLGLSPQERQKLKIELMNAEDDFDNDFNK